VNVGALPAFSRTKMASLKSILQNSKHHVVFTDVQKLLNSTEFTDFQTFRKFLHYTPLQAIWHVVWKIPTIPLCSNPTCNKPTRWNTNIKREYSKFCSSKCFGSDQQTIQNRKDTCVERYGVPNVSTAQVIKDRKVATCLRNHGVEHPQQSAKVRVKTVAAVQDHYGVDNVSQSAEVLAKKKATWTKIWGYDNPSKSPVIKRIIGRKVGIASGSKKIVVVRGKEFVLQGYEPQALHYLLKFFDGSDIHCHSSGKVPDFEYTWGISHMFFPDFWIQSVNCVVEVKSTWTLCRNRGTYRVMRAKATAVKRAGFRFRLLIIDTDGKPIPIPKNWHKLNFKQMRVFLSEHSVRGKRKMARCTKVKL